jgi:4-diphosphocytidyl-2-C-methyl-D-erythritol kinase
MRGVLTIRAHAKINLWLRVGARRADGFHEVRTVYQALAWHDRLEFVVRPGPATLTCTDPELPVDGRNLVWRAMLALWRRLGRAGDPAGVAVHLVKRLPVEAGLGGGSADAAAALVALDRLWNAGLSEAALVELAAAVGSDVPFFLVGGTALGTGRGERVSPLPDLPAHAVVLVHPPVRIATAEAYRWLDADRAASAEAPLEAEPPLAAWPGPIVNDLEGPVARRCPAVGRARAALLEAGAVSAGLSGSGAVVFGLFAGRGAAAAAERLAAEGWRVRVTRTLGRAEYARRARPRACGGGDPGID